MREVDIWRNRLSCEIDNYRDAIYAFEHMDISEGDDRDTILCKLFLQYGSTYTILVEAGMEYNIDISAFALHKVLDDPQISDKRLAKGIKHLYEINYNDGKYRTRRKTCEPDGTPLKEPKWIYILKANGRFPY